MTTFRGDGTPTSGNNFVSQSELDEAVDHAEEWANKAEDSLVSTAAGGDQVDDYSALHHANKAAADLVLTNADVVSTNADVVLTNADVVSTNADVVSTNADAVSTDADATAAAASAAAASTSETNAATSETNAAASWDSFDDRYLGAKASDPTLDNDGDALLTGALYFNSTANNMRAYNGATWDVIDAYVTATATTEGIIELATQAEVDAGTDTSRAVTPATLASAAGLGAVTADENAIINGGFDIWQRGSSFTNAGGWTADRWTWSGVGTGVVNVVQGSNVPTGERGLSLQVNVTGTDTSIAAGDWYGLSTKIEGFASRELGFGATGAGNVTLGFWTRANAGTYCVKFGNGAASYSYIVEYTVDVSNTWEYKTITIPTTGAGVWAEYNTLGLQIVWMLACGTNLHGAGDTWLAANKLATSGISNNMGAINNFYLKNVTLNRGDGTPESFPIRSFDTELRLCQRYYENSFDLNVTPAQGLAANKGLTAAAYSVSTARIHVPFKVPKRATPSLTYYSSDSASTSSAFWDYYDGTTWQQSTATSTATINQSGIAVDIVDPSALTQFSAYLASGHWAASSEM